MESFKQRIAEREQKEKKARDAKLVYVQAQAEKRKLRELDIKQNQHTMKLMKDVKAYKVYEKHLQKEKYLNDLS